LFVDDFDSLFAFKRFVERLIEIKNDMFVDFKSAREESGDETHLEE
jgi:hypothetical protein